MFLHGAEVSIVAEVARVLRTSDAPKSDARHAIAKLRELGCLNERGIAAAQQECPVPVAPVDAKDAV